MLTCQGDKFIVARWMFDDNLQALWEDLHDFTRDDLVTGADVAVLRNYEELNTLASQIKDEIKEFYDEVENGDEPKLFDDTVWSWHIPDEQDGIPKRCILFRGDTEMCTIHLEQVAPISPIKEEHS